MEQQLAFQISQSNGKKHPLLKRRFVGSGRTIRKLLDILRLETMQVFYVYYAQIWMPLSDF